MPSAIQSAAAVRVEHQPCAQGQTLHLVQKHPRAIRWMHWVNFPLLMIMIWSGLMIYWADSATGYTLEHQVYRVGVGPWTLFRLFPDWFYRSLRLQAHLTRGLAFHAFFAWFYALNGVAYAIYLAWSGAWRSLWPGRGSVRQAWQVLKADLLLRPYQTARQKYNGAQRLAYTAVAALGAGSLITGVAVWKPVSLGWLTAMCGGYQAARWLHFWITIAFCIFFAVHLLQVMRAGWNTLRAMLTGYELEPVSPEERLP